MPSQAGRVDNSPKGLRDHQHYHRLKGYFALCCFDVRPYGAPEPSASTGAISGPVRMHARKVYTQTGTRAGTPDQGADRGRNFRELAIVTSTPAAEPTSSFKRSPVYARTHLFCVLMKRSGGVVCASLHRGS